MPRALCIMSIRNSKVYPFILIHTSPAVSGLTVRSDDPEEASVLQGM
jgi:hypothetical protein